VLSILFMLAINVALFWLIAAFVFSKGEVHIQTIHDYDYDRIEHEHYWRGYDVGSR